MACCGSECSLTIGGISDDIHSFSIEVAGNPIDVTTFTSDGKDWLSCSQDGTLTVETYALLAGISESDTDIAWSAVVCGSTISAKATCTGISIPVNAKDVPSMTYSFKITGAITGL